MDNSFDRRTWPEIFKPILIRDNKFYKINEALLALGIAIHVKKKGYKWPYLHINKEVTFLKCTHSNQNKQLNKLHATIVGISTYARGKHGYMKENY